MASERIAILFDIDGTARSQEVLLQRTYFPWSLDWGRSARDPEALSVQW